MADVLKKVPVREQDAKVRATNFEEVCLGYNMEEAMEEASRCLNCKNAKCIQGCPVSIDISGLYTGKHSDTIEFFIFTYSRYFLFTNRGDHNILRCNFCLSCHNILDLSSIRICKFFCFYYDIRRVCVNTYNRFRKSF